MKLLLAADLHITSKTPLSRVDDYPSTQMGKVRWIAGLAKEAACDAVLVAGDFFDSPVQPYPLLAEYIYLLTEQFPPVYCVFGQHDTAFRRRQNTALAFLEELGLVTVAGRKPISLGEGLYLYGASYDEEIPVPRKRNWGANILLAHLLVTDGKPWPGCEELFPLKKVSSWAPGYSLVVCGDNHETLVHEGRSCTVFNPGSLMRSRVDQREHVPVVGIWQSSSCTLEMVEVPVLPAQEVLDFESKEESQEFLSLMESFVAAVKDYDVGVDFLRNLSLAVKATRGLPPLVKRVIYEAVERCGYGKL